MIWANQWRSLGQWMDRLPWWQAIVVLPPLTPLLLVATACLCPRTTTVAVMTLIAVYVPLIRSGVIGFSWEAAWSGLGRGYLGLVSLGSLCIVQAWLEQALERSKGGKPAAKRTVVSRLLWDRELDG